ncbi:hypothetical protein [Pseudooceanicola sp.]|uniref:hypothetical protein n=1 Tax=Pseudooceanicola sp. TaxID=1914328 RepID=UPI0026324BA5|nr:hypothetical protein [Pseudooceanicola sp.]MDF1854309.1 hypothetical protein [Pseudooceanicola sp.]
MFQRHLDLGVALAYTSGMSTNDRSGATREERLKQALKANIARRKAQAKARVRDDEADQTDDRQENGDG